MKTMIIGDLHDKVDNTHKLINHKQLRESFIWITNSVRPIITRKLSDLSDSHLINIINTVTHLSEYNIKALKTEILGRIQGTYPSIEEYSKHS